MAQIHRILIIFCILLPQGLLTPLSDLIGNLTIPPLKAGQTQVFTFSYQSYSQGLLDVRITLNHETYVDVMIHQLHRKVGIEIIPVSFTLSGQLLIRPDTRLTISATKNEKTVAKTVYISLKDQQIIYPQYSGSAYESYSSVARIDALGKVSHLKERLMFDHFDSLVEQSYSLYFPLEMFSIQHNLASLGYPLSPRLAELQFEDRSQLFPRLPKIANSAYRSIPLRFQLVNDVYYFSFNQPLYVDKETRMMSLIPDTGFQLTNKLYFPTNTHDQTQFFNFRIKLWEVGVNANEIDYRATLYSRYRYFGEDAMSYFTVTVEDIDPPEDIDLREIVIHE